MKYETGHKFIFVFLIVLELKVEQQHNSDFQSHFSISKIGGILLIMYCFIEARLKGDQL